MTIQPSSARQKYMDGVRAMLDAGEYIALLESEGAMVNSAEFKRAAFGNYQPQAHDIIVSTYPKSGTNWTMQIAQEIAWYGEAVFEHVNSAIPWPDATIKTPIAQLNDRHMLANAPTGLRIIKSHLDAAFVPYTSEAKYICVVRDPKDVLVSSFHFENGFIERMVGDGVPLDAYVEGFLLKRFIYNGWAEHIASWWALRERENVLVLSFEAMKRAPERAIEQIATLMKVSLSAEQFAKVAHKSSYAYMKANDHKFSPPTPPDYQTQGQISMIRQGRVGAGQSALSAEQRDAIDQFCIEQLQLLGSDFPYQTHYKP
ncbi:MAG: sulfotransferase domain-containing protein [Candidatus Promineifilaceae bacterium]